MATATELKGLRKEVEELVAIHAAGKTAVNLRKYRGRVEAFAEEVLRVRMLTETQREHLRAVVASPRIAAYGANGCGKTFDDAILALYFIYVEDFLVIATSAKEAQLRDQYMRDIRRLFVQAPELVGELYTMQLRRPTLPDSGLLCMASSGPDNLRSYHAPRVMVQLQEAQGLPDFAFDSAEMMALGADDRITLTGNSSQPGGMFHKRCLSPRWATVRFNAEEHPNVIEGRVIIPGGPTRESIAARAADYGTDSAFYVSSVCGLFPSEAIEAITTRAALEKAFAKHESAHADSMIAWVLPVHLAWDVALRGEDLNVLSICQESYVREIHTWRADDINVSYNQVQAHAERAADFYATREQRERARQARAAAALYPANYGEPSRSRPTLVIDGAGMGGPAVDEMRKRGFPVVDFIGAAASSAPDRYANLRAESLFLFRLALEKGQLALPRNDQLAEEALATTWTMNTHDRIQIIAKADLRTVIGRSPDVLDSVTMGIWYTLTQTERRWGVSHFKL